MRDILFRGKRKDSGLWEVGDFSTYTTSDKVFHTFINGFEYEVHPETVGQYTGLTDKDGQKIFEGDIIRNSEFDEEDGYGVVEFRDGAFEVNGHGLSCTFHENFWGKDCEVVGDIYDNPELLGGADNG